MAPLAFADFRKLFAARAISVAGSTLTPVALGLGVLQATGSTTDLGIVLAAATIPTVAVLLVGGVLADRMSRKLLMVLANATCGVAQLALGAMLVADRFSLWWAVALQVVIGFGQAFYFPASTGLTVQTVPAAALQQANALLSLVSSVAGSLGPLAAGGLVLSVGAGWALVADGCSYLVSALCLSALRRTTVATPGGEPFGRQLVAGFREVTSRSWVWSSILVFALSHLAVGVLMVLGPTLALGWAHGIITWAAVLGCMSLGQVIGDLWALRFVPSRPLLACRLAELLAVPLLPAVALGASTPVLLVAAVLFGMSMTFPDALWFTAMQQHLPATVLSRVSSYDWAGSLALRPVGLLGAAGLAGLVGIPTALFTVAALLVVTRVAGLLVKDVRSLRSVAGPPSVSDAATA
ncbi:MAG TPA: MFS transporter [Jiangellales bacterium]|nr:MFS transporter [Jiangellales bacterium]